MRRLAFAVTIVCTLLFTIACGGDKKPTPWIPPDGGLDGGGDGGGDAGMDAAVMAPQCQYSTLNLLNDANGSAVDVTVAGGASSFQVVWTQTRSGTRYVLGRNVPKMGDATAEATVFDGTGRTGVMEAPTVAWVGTEFQTAFVDSGDFAGRELYVGALSETGSVTAPHRLTNDTASQDTPALAVVGGATTLYFAQSDAMNPSAVRRQALDSLGNVSGASASVASGTAIDGPVRIVELGTGSAIAWVDPAGQLELQALSSAGLATGAVHGLATSSNAVRTSFDVAGSELQGAAVFGVTLSGVRSEVRFRPFDTTGATSGPELVLTTGSSQGRFPAIAPLAGGYVVAYRYTDGVATKVRVQFLGQFGYVLDTKDVADITSFDGDLAIGVTTEGNVLVVFSDVTPSGLRIDAVRLLCGG